MSEYTVTAAPPRIETIMIWCVIVGAAEPFMSSYNGSFGDPPTFPSREEDHLSNGSVSLYDLRFFKESRQKYNDLPLVSGIYDTGEHHYSLFRCKP